MTPEELARIKIDKQLNDAGWDIVSRMDYMPNTALYMLDELSNLSNMSEGHKDLLTKIINTAYQEGKLDGLRQFYNPNISDNE